MIALDPHRYFFVSSLFFIVILFSGQNISWFFILGGKVFLVHCQFGQYVYYESGKSMYKLDGGGTWVLGVVIQHDIIRYFSYFSTV